jgi:hypothetical protein
VKERAQHRRAFDCYVRLGTDRSLDALAHALHDDPSLCGLRHAPGRRTIERWSSVFHWQDRIVDIERAARERDKDDQITALRDMNERHKKEGVALQHKALERIAALQPDALSPGDAIRGLMEGVRLERLAVGAPTEHIRQEGDSLDGQHLRRFSTEELRRLAELAERRAAGAGEEEPRQPA